MNLRIFTNFHEFFRKKEKIGKMEDEEYLQRVIRTIQSYQNDTLNRLSYMQKTLQKSSIKHNQILMNSGLGMFFGFPFKYQLYI